MPKYKFFLESDKKNVGIQVNEWINVIKPICEGIDKLMWIIRESNEPIATVAVGGLYNHQIARQTQISLVRILTNTSDVYPEISGGRHLIAVRFFKQNKEGKYLQFEGNVEFRISLC